MADRKLGMFRISSKTNPFGCAPLDTGVEVVFGSRVAGVLGKVKLYHLVHNNKPNFLRKI